MPANPAPPAAAPAVLPGITVANEVWELHADPKAIRLWSRAWSDLSDAAREAVDRLQRRAAAVRNHWEGAAADAWRDFQFSLLGDIGDFGDDAVWYSNFLWGVAKTLDDAQELLGGLRQSALDACPNVSAVDDSLVFQPLTPGAARAVLAAVDDAQRARQLVLSGAFSRKAETLGKDLHDIAARRSKDGEAKSNKFVLPPESHHNAGVIKYKDADGREHVVVNTGAGDDSVSIATSDATPDAKHPHPDEPKLHVAVNGTDHTFSADADLTVRTGDGNDTVTEYRVGTETSMPPAPPVTVIGGTGDDNIATMGGADTIVGGPGDNQILAAADDQPATSWVDDGPDGGLVKRSSA